MQLSFSPASASVFVFSLKPSSALFIYLLFFSLVVVVALVAGQGSNDSIATCEFSTWLIRRLHANINAKIMR